MTWLVLTLILVLSVCLLMVGFVWYASKWVLEQYCSDNCTHRQIHLEEGGEVTAYCFEYKESLDCFSHKATLRCDKCLAAMKAKKV